MFVDRDQTGEIVASYFGQQRPGQEQVADNAPELLAFWQALFDPVPGQVSAGQFLRALNQQGLLAAVDAAVAQADTLTQRLYSRAPFFLRNDPEVTAIATAIGKTSADLDNLFRLAATL